MLERLALLVFVVLVQSMPARTMTHAMSSNTFAILQADMRLGLLKVSENAVTVENRQLVRGDKQFFPVKARLSPKAEQIAILSPKIGTSLLFYMIIYDLPSNNIIEIDERWIERNSIVWSSDGQYLAYARQSTTTYVDRLIAEYDVMVFEVKTRKLTPVLQNVPYIPTIAWSHDGSRFAAGAAVCYSEKAQKECQLGIYDARAISTQMRPINTLSISSLRTPDRLPPAIGSDAAVICDLQWSPDDSFISFTGGCGGTAVGSVQRDLVISQSDKFSPQFASQTSVKTQKHTSDSVWSELSSYAWFSQDQIFFSHWSQNIMNPVQTTSQKLQIFDVKSKKLDTVADTTGDNWAKHPVQNWIGYRQTSNYDASAVGFPAKDRLVKVVSVNGTTLTELYRGSDGCGLEWSPDGETLFYVNRHIDGFDLTVVCQGGSDTTGFEFVRFTDGKPTSTFVDVKMLDNPTIYFFPLGWVDLTAIQQKTN
jgi:hypothetical protein